MDYQEKIERVEIPKSTGVEGFLHAIKAILQLPNIQKIEISGKGEVSYRYFVPKDAKDVATGSLKVSFETLEPYGVIRNGKVVELMSPALNAAVAIGQLFNMASLDHLHPLALVGGANTELWAWYEGTTSIHMPTMESLYGLPFYGERMLEDNVLVLCAGFVRDGSLIDTQKSYKLCIPPFPEVPNVE